MKRKNCVIMLAALLAGALAAAGCIDFAIQPWSGNTSYTASPAPGTSTTTPASAPTPGGPAGPSSISTMSTNGLKLSLSLNSTTFQPWEEITITIDEQNTLSDENKALASQKWALDGLSLGPCGTINHPFGIAIFEGDYDSANVSTAKPLHLYNPDAEYHCPMIVNVTAYIFQPSSDVAAIYDGDNTSPFGTAQMKSQITVKRYWTGSPATMTDFAPGIYTIAAGDEWGALAVLHFVKSK